MPGVRTSASISSECSRPVEGSEGPLASPNVLLARGPGAIRGTTGASPSGNGTWLGAKISRVRVPPLRQGAIVRAVDNPAPDQRTCAECGPQPSSAFGRTSAGYYRAYCKKCHNRRASARTQARRKTDIGRERERVKSRHRRKDPTKLSRFILEDSRKSDRRAGRTCDLTREFIEGLIVPGCLYCGETQLRMTLDRIDNSLGHTQVNVNAACIRCNYLRRDMPYGAWLLLVGALREARLRGAFGTWTCRAR